MKYLLDTNVLSGFARGPQAVIARLRGLKIVRHNERELVRVGVLGLEDWRSR